MWKAKSILRRLYSTKSALARWELSDTTEALTVPKKSLDLYWDLGEFSGEMASSLGKLQGPSLIHIRVLGGKSCSDMRM